jgi:putative two-component system hydrogenase maturation factor HypX/HoxX
MQALGLRIVKSNDGTKAPAAASGLRMDSRAAQPAAQPHVRDHFPRRRMVASGRVVQRRLRVLFLVSAHNSLSQRVQIVLTELGHEVAVAVVASSGEMQAAVDRHRPELIVCPMLKTIIPESIFGSHRCLIVHPGPRGDRGPSSLDWAIELGAGEWGVTVLEATAEVDAGDIWATRTFATREASKTSLYRHEVRRAAVEAVVQAVTRVANGRAAPEPLDYDDPLVTGRPRPLLRQSERAIDWASDPTATVLRRIRAAEGHPGVLDTVAGIPFHLFGAHNERALRGRPGELLAQRHGAVCRATADGAVWITHLKAPGSYKLPAARALEVAGVELDVPEIPVPLHTPVEQYDTFREISYEEHNGVGYLYFDFYNGAMSTDQCRRLLDAYRYAAARRQTDVIVLMGGRDFFSNGIHLNVIEAADNPAGESWWNLHAINDIVREIVETDTHVTIAALAGDAAAGGVPLALAADHVVAREDAVLNPYYAHMGGLYGSEYWTYLLPRRVGTEMTAQLTRAPFEAVGTQRAVEIGLLDDAFGANVESFRAGVSEIAEQFAGTSAVDDLLHHKRLARRRDELIKPLSAYRAEELKRSHECFFGDDRSYHEARHRFVHKLGPACAVSRASGDAHT